MINEIKKMEEVPIMLLLAWSRSVTVDERLESCY